MSPSSFRLGRRAAAFGLIAVVVVSAGYATQERWLPLLHLGAPKAVEGEAAEAHDHGHDHGGGDAPTSVVVSDQAQKNLGLKTGEVQLTDYWRTLTLSGVLVEQPGHGHRKVAAPLTGIVRAVYVHPNEIIRPGDVVADLELTGDALAVAQADLLAVVRDLEINARETARVSELVEGGSVPAKTKLQLEYERKRLESQLESKNQALEVLGLSKKEIEGIQSERRLLREFTIRAPGFSFEEKSHRHDAEFHGAAAAPEAGREGPKGIPVGLKPSRGEAGGGSDEGRWVYTAESIDVTPGQRVQIGDELCSLAFHALLYVEGRAFEKEGEIVSQAMVNRWPVQAVFELGETTPVVRKGLTILYFDNVVDPQTRTFRLFIPLANEVLHDSAGPNGETYRSWRFKPGQKVTVRVPVEKMSGVVVLPVEAVVREGLDSYVFRANGSKMERQSVQVKYTGAGEVVLVDDGSLFAGDVVALNNAYQLNLAMKKAAGQGGGGGHEGHDHSGHNH